MLNKAQSINAWTLERKRKTVEKLLKKGVSCESSDKTCCRISLNMSLSNPNKQTNDS